ncbi:hypothetical protein ACLOJK_034834 [Asimina triloba]
MLEYGLHGTSEELRSDFAGYGVIYVRAKSDDGRNRGLQVHGHRVEPLISHGATLTTITSTVLQFSRRTTSTTATSTTLQSSLRGTPITADLSASWFASKTTRKLGPFSKKVSRFNY